MAVAAHFDRWRETRGILLSFARSIQERDIVTYEHSRRVATYAQRLARYLGWSRREAHDLALAALVHDLGKTWIANDILNKSGALSDDDPPHDHGRWWRFQRLTPPAVESGPATARR